MSKNTITPVQLIYTGGTIGCVGTPLSPLPTDAFNSQFKDTFSSFDSVTFYESKQARIIDSSQVTPHDLANLYKTIHTSIDNGFTKILILQGTDTLSYTASFIAHVFAQVNVQIVFVASMLPLFKPDVQPLTVDASSDANENITLAINWLQKETINHNDNVYIACGDIHNAFNTQKIQRNKAPAFSFDKNSTHSALHNGKTNFSDTVYTNIAQSNIECIYCVPQNTNQLENTIERIVSDNSTDALILMGYGSGNIPETDKIHSLLLKTHEQGIMVVVSSQVVFGDITTDYAAASWLQKCNVLSSGNLTIPACFARLTYIISHYESVSERKKIWHTLLK